MTRLYNDPAAFSDDMLTGFADAHRQYVRKVAGGVVRATPPPPGKTVVIVGGGAGHYPAFCGLVGPGFADGAVVGNVFTSPSAAQVESVARAAATSGGVLLLSGNYTGDTINFDIARNALCADGIETVYLTVTDDVASAPPQEHARRRGVAGGFVVFKVAAAAADGGAPLAEVARVATHANAMTRTIGVAFDGCTLPGDSTPLFTVPAGRMGIGLGIHGEPGVDETAVPTAAELAELLVDRLLDNAPVSGTGRVAVVLNGFGGVKYEELFVVWSSVAVRLRSLGLEVVDPEIGELVTSLDMAGCSLTLSWLDDELEALWSSAADTPAFRRGGAVLESTRASGANQSEHDRAEVVEPVRPTAEPDRYATAVVEALSRVVDTLEDIAPELGRLDAVAGDGDHGRGMTRGAAAALTAAQRAAAVGDNAGATLIAAGDAWAARAGGTSGVLWGAGLAAAGRSLADVSEPNPENWVSAVRVAYEEVRRLGKATPGDKTMLDALAPFVDAVDAELAADSHWQTAWSKASDAAEDAARDTADLRPRVGRARPLAEKSIGTPDPGAVSLAACARAAMPATDSVAK
ncbi:dihydroxyacetone kinase [Rhodococcus sp. 27YEA15]|uniref:dihydroxyacetone kinase family protein n=1 Tax=Rhodococcus sp. 27YEA15 TaxID=3156259 RepID=UPI003C7B22CD